jgi:hypothetical protein
MHNHRADMSRLERRRSNSSVDDLRRELRDADHERFYLQGAVNTAADEWLSRDRRRPTARRVKKIAIVACTAGALLLVGGIVWARLDISRPTDDRKPVTVAPPFTDVRTADRTVIPAHEIIAVRSPLAPINAPRTRVRRTAAHLPSPARVQPTKRATVPRPLSPGEFGRTPPRAHDRQ